MGFKSLSLKREVLSLGLCAKMDPFPVAPLAVGPFVPFASENVQIGWPTFVDRFRKTGQDLIVLPRPGLSREGSAPWECHTALGSRRTGTTRGTSPRKSSTGDQTGRRTRIRPISGVEQPQNHTKGTPRKSNQLEHCQKS